MTLHIGRVVIHKHHREVNAACTAGFKLLTRNGNSSPGSMASQKSRLPWLTRSRQIASKLTRKVTSSVCLSLTLSPCIALIVSCLLNAGDLRIQNINTADYVSP